MTTSETKCRYHLLGLLMALVFVGGLLLLVPEPPDAQAQVAPITVDKECSPNPVGVGQPLTCTIDVLPSDPRGSSDIIQVTDTLPDGVTVTGATQQQLQELGLVVSTQPCTVTGNTVTCPPETVGFGFGEPLSLRITIDSIAQQCGTFTNTAEAQVVQTGTTVTDSEEITVEGCEGGAARGGGGPVTLEIGDAKNESGEITTENDFSISP